MFLTREAGGSIKPGVERGFASGTPGTVVENIQSRGAADSRRDIGGDRSITLGWGIHAAIARGCVTAVGGFAGSIVFGDFDPGVSLRAPPRAGSPAEQLGWGARLYADVRSAHLSGDIFASRGSNRLAASSEQRIANTQISVLTSAHGNDLRKLGI